MIPLLACFAMNNNAGCAYVTFCSNVEIYYTEMKFNDIATLFAAKVI